MEAALLKFTLSALVIDFADTFLLRFADAIADLTKLGNTSPVRQGQRHG